MSKPNASFADVSEISDWISYDFSIKIIADDEIDEKTSLILSRLTKDFIVKYMPNYQNEFEVLDKYDLLISNSVYLKNVTEKNLIELKEDIDKFIKIAISKDFEIALCARFIPNSSPQKYASIKIKFNGNDTELQYTKL